MDLRGWGGAFEVRLYGIWGIVRSELREMGKKPLLTITFIFEVRYQLWRPRGIIHGK